MTINNSSLTDLQQIGLKHSIIELVKDIQNNRTGIPRKTFIAEGLYEHNAILENDIHIDTFLWSPEDSYSDESTKRANEIAARAKRSFQISSKTLSKIAERPNPDGLISVAKLTDWQPDTVKITKNSLVIVADGIEIPGNLGTLIRTLDACRADCLILTNRKTRMTHPKVLRSSQGMSMKIPFIEFEDTKEAIKWLKAKNFNVYIADTDQSINYKKCDYEGRTALIVGSERYGVSKPWYEEGFMRVGIPMLGTADSLNVSISASILLYEARSQKDKW